MQGAVQQGLLVIGERAADVEHVVRPGQQPEPLTEARRDGGAGQHRGRRVLPPPEPFRETPRRRRGAPPAGAGACSGPSTQATWLCGQLQHLIQVADQMAGRLLGPQCRARSPGSDRRRRRPRPAGPPGRLGGSRPGSRCTRSRTMASAPGRRRRAAGAGRRRGAGASASIRPPGLLDGHSGGHVVEQRPGGAGQRLEPPGADLEAERGRRRCPRARGPRRRRPGRGRGAAPRRWPGAVTYRWVLTTTTSASAARSRAASAKHTAAGRARGRPRALPRPDAHLGPGRRARFPRQLGPVARSPRSPAQATSRRISRPSGPSSGGSPEPLAAGADQSSTELLVTAGRPRRPAGGRCSWTAP